MRGPWRGKSGYKTKEELMAESELAGMLLDGPGTCWTRDPLTIEAGHRLVNVGWLFTDGEFANEGQWINRANGVVRHQAYASNAGSLFNDGQYRSGFFRNAGRLMNRAAFEVNDFTNASGGDLCNGGTFAHTRLVNEAGARVETCGTLVCRGGVVNAGEFLVSGRVDNEGSGWDAVPAAGGAIANSGGGRFTVTADGSVSGPGTYVQTGAQSITRVDGTLAAGSIDITGGQLAGAGMLTGVVGLSGVLVCPGDPRGTLTIDGDVFAEETCFEIGLTAPGLCDRVAVTGSARFGAGVRVDFLIAAPEGPVPDSHTFANTCFDWLDVAGRVEGLGGIAWRLVLVGQRGCTILARSDAGPCRWGDLDISFHGTQISFGRPAGIMQGNLASMAARGAASLTGFRTPGGPWTRLRD
jgi:hypothetical protein